MYANTTSDKISNLLQFRLVYLIDSTHFTAINIQDSRNVPVDDDRYCDLRFGYCVTAHAAFEGSYVRHEHHSCRAIARPAHSGAVEREPCTCGRTLEWPK